MIAMTTSSSINVNARRFIRVISDLPYLLLPEHRLAAFPFRYGTHEALEQSEQRRKQFARRIVTSYLSHCCH